ncbi:hypothetical protein METEAL_12900 [Mesoterricola silvestris]|uniref:Uncharacterized protein n=2 Tax=Mesoterricola silvestris TaxID=2927979 RepID=A0AA48GG34_9BACT|nr:hypothetical protein METEAL_12900 [Mesoterricola silvestris]
MLVLAPAASATPPGVGLPDLGPGAAWVPLESFRDGAGTHARWVQFLDSLPVLGSEGITHASEGASLPATPSLALLRGAGGAAHLPPVLGAHRPILEPARAVAALQARFPAANSPRLSKPLLVLFPVMRALDLARPGETDALARPRVAAGYVRAYRVEARWPGPDRSRDAVHVLDATSGRVLEERPLAPALGTPVRVRVPALDPATVDLDATLPPGGGRPLLRDPVRGLAGGNTVEACGDAGHTGEARVVDLGEKPGDEGERTAASAAHALAAAWTYFERVHGRHGFDGRGTRVRVLLGGPPADDVHWDRSGATGIIRVGRAQAYDPLVFPAILGHEFTHGVIGSSRAGLDGCAEARGLDEATADFFGQMIDTWSRTGGGNPASGLFSNHIGDGGTAWRLQVQPRPKGTEPELMRHMAEPARMGHPDRWFPALGRIQDPHVAAGPLNRALCFLSAGAAATGSPEEKASPRPGGAPPWSSPLLPQGMAGIGNDRAAAIWYQALTQELQPLSDYRDARRAALAVARRLYGPDSREDLAVRDAFGAVGVGKPGRLTEPVDAWLPSVEVSAEPLGEEVLLALAVPDPSQVKCVAFLVDGVQVGKAGAAPFHLRLPASRLLANGPHGFRAALRDREDQVVHSREVAFTLANPRQQVLLDPGLQSEDFGSGGWVTDARLESAEPPPPGLPGSECRVFDATSLRPGKHPYLAQEVALPPGPVRLELRLWTHVSAPAPGSEDALVIRVQGPHGGTHRELARITHADAGEGWVQRVFPLDGLAGERIDLQFASQFSEGSTMRIRLADVRILAEPRHADPAPLP